MFFALRVFVTLLFAACGAVVGLAAMALGLFALAQLHGRLSGDTTAGGALSFLILPLGPVGIVGGILLGVMAANRLFVGRRKIGVKILKSGD